jgi:hypothetical protein
MILVFVLDCQDPDLLARFWIEAIVERVVRRRGVGVGWLGR